MKAKHERTIRRILDPANLPVLSAEQEQMLAAVAAKPDATIDYSDAPPTAPEAEWYRAASTPLYCSK